MEVYSITVTKGGKTCLYKKTSKKKRKEKVVKHQVQKTSILYTHTTLSVRRLRQSQFKMNLTQLQLTGPLDHGFTLLALMFEEEPLTSTAALTSTWDIKGMLLIFSVFTLLCKLSTRLSPSKI